AVAARAAGGRAGDDPEAGGAKSKNHSSPSPGLRLDLSPRAGRGDYRRLRVLLSGRRLSEGAPKSRRMSRPSCPPCPSWLKGFAVAVFLFPASALAADFELPATTAVPKINFSAGH